MASTNNLPPLINALLEPARFPHPVQKVELMETHGAWVLLAGEFAYKIKKPVRFPFMDFSTLALRRQACETEVRVNRRFQNLSRPATQLYLGVLPILGTPGQPRWGEPGKADAGQPIEFAVQMRRFDEASRLDHLCERGALTPEHMAGLAWRMALFQARAAVATSDQPWGHPTAAMRWPRDNFDTLRTALTDPADTALVRELGEWTEQRYNAIEPLLSRRRQKGRVREGHGDLHLANLVLIGGDGEVEVLPFDAIEFNDSLRWIDVANDMAFAWMDLLAHARPGLANVLLSAWLDASGDVSAHTVWTFYASYRAGVRAKVAAIRLGQLGGAGSSPEADASLAEVRRYLALARDIAHPPAPLLLITHGLSGSGKTWASSRWLAAEASGRAIRLRSDVERKRLHGMSALATSGSGLNSGLYTPKSNSDTYASLLSRARLLLADGWTVLVDAAFLRAAERAEFAALAQGAGVPFHILACDAPVEVLRQRITERQARGADASEATVEVLEKQLDWVEPLTPAEREAALTPESVGRTGSTADAG
ncbi:bifunctional aminoglycoside phosphotransferase/ATP-binding protein [Hydrogenophaga sp.]|uniref:bifunctional aminoglycoside phosphotransferase/ATP-binding protein n=1 Tax=Hydrogenophaga sp. TaxID=1904254 RepID=UPI002718E99C|nr:bifunctional aminoglycoside phosphotransferase/ATP-binding protein [Hydrogenophaga sp.]MDO8905163.1 AAA family ATPase [Hydrogenophaga sp.]